MADIAPELLTKIQKEFEERFSNDKEIEELYARIRFGTAGYQEANEFALKVGSILAEVYRNNLSADVLPDGRMYYDIAQRIIDPTMKNNYVLIAEATNQIQKSLNEVAGIGIKAVTPELNQDRIDKIIDRVSDAEQFDKISWILDEPVKNFSQSIVDDAVRVNAEFQYEAGLSPVIVRKLAGGCCDWCRALAGTYRYPDEVPKDVYRRHQRCRCTVEYDPKDGKIQNVHSKRWRNAAEPVEIDVHTSVGKKEVKEPVKKISPQKREQNIIRKYELKDASEQKKERIQNAKKLTAKDLDGMSTAKLRKLAKENAVEYYKSGLSGISFGNHDVEKAAEALTENASRTSLKKDILAMQKKMAIANTNKNSIIKAEDIVIHKGVGAKAKNYRILLPDGSDTHLTEGTRITNIQVIAGKGRNREIDVVDSLVEKYGGIESEWQKKKGFGYIDYKDESYCVELHWYEEPTVGKYEWKVKTDGDGNWFYED